jgi:methyl-accepting chemotaxis protein
MNARKYGLYGFLLGICFPLLGALIQALSGGGGTEAAAPRAGGASQMWLLVAVPFVMGAIGWFTGMREDQFRVLERAKGEQLASTASELASGAQALFSTVSSFSSMTSQTAGTIRETTATMQQLSQTATRAALSAETVVGLANASKKCSEDGIQEIKVSISELLKLSEEVRGLARSIEGVNDRMRNIFEIASVMNYLGERFEGLADSAAAEIGQEGAESQLPLGLRFIVAEMRRQGKDAKNGALLVQNIITDMQKAMAATMTAAETGVRRAERGAQIADKTGENIKRLGSALQNSSQAAMEIASIARQQDQGIDGVMKAMNGVYVATEQAVASTQRVAEEARALNELASRLDASVRVSSLPAPALQAPQNNQLRITGSRS